MKIEQLQQILKAETGIKAEGGGVFSIGEDVDLTLVLELGHDGMSVPRVRKLTVQGDLLILETHKGERVYTSALLRVVKVGASESGKARGTGFTALR